MIDWKGNMVLECGVFQRSAKCSECVCQNDLQRKPFAVCHVVTGWEKDASVEALGLENRSYWEANMVLGFHWTLVGRKKVN